MKEIRNQGTVTINVDEESRHVEGYALIFNSLSNDLGGFTEVIEKDALNDEIIQRSDILAVMNHDSQRGVLARSKNGEGSLKLEIDERGLKYSFDAPNTQLGNELLEGLRRKDISQSSFGFVVETDEVKKDNDGMFVRTIKKFKELFDVSPVYFPAYDSTSVTVDTRSIDKYKANEKAELAEYFENLKSQI